MNYVCLAAGKGTRFGHLGSYLQKCMYPVGLKPFVELSIRNILESPSFTSGQDNLTFVVGHHSEQIKAYFGSEFEGLSVHYVHQKEQLGTGHALYLVQEALSFSESVIVWLADMYVPVRLFEQMQTHEAPNVQSIGPGQEGEKEDLKVTTSGNRILKAWKGEEALYDIGFWKLSPEVLKLMTQERHGEYRMVPNLQYAIEAGHELGFIKSTEWIHLGGTLPTVEENVLNVVQRVLTIEASKKRSL